MGRPRRIRKVSSPTSRVNCICCRIHRDIVGPLSRRGICNECRIVHGLAQMLGLTRVVYETRTITGVLLNTYSGIVRKAA